MAYVFCRTWGDMQAHLGRDAFVSGLRGVRIWGEAQLRMGQGTGPTHYFSLS